MAEGNEIQKTYAAELSGGQRREQSEGKLERPGKSDRVENGTGGRAFYRQVNPKTKNMRKLVR